VAKKCPPVQSRPFAFFTTIAVQPSLLFPSNWVKASTVIGFRFDGYMVSYLKNDINPVTLLVFYVVYVPMCLKAAKYETPIASSNPPVSGQLCY